MGTFRELATAYEAKIRALEESRKTNALVIAGDMVALVINRVQNKGIGADGEKFEKYSTNPLPLFFFKDGNSKSKSDKFKADVKKKKAEPNYETYRRYLGLPTDKRTLTVTGDMFRKVRQEIIEHNQFVTIVEIRGGDAFSQNKVNWNSNDLGGSILRPNKQELAMVERANKERIRKVLANE